jgi:hypothetical protein
MGMEGPERARRTLEAFPLAIKDPASAQETLLPQLVDDYSKTEYGEGKHATSIEEYREQYPIVNYRDLEPWFGRVRSEEYGVFLSEAPITWVMTRGTTGKSKIIPVTAKHMDHLVKGGSRGILSFAMERGGFESLMGGVLNLQFPSNMYKMRVGDQELELGFSSGTYARLNPMMEGLQLVPRQEDIDALETGLTKEGWDERYEFIYQKAKDQRVVTIMGVAPVQTGFARYVKRRHGVLPRDLWNLKVIYTTSVAKIQQRYKPRLQGMYGDVPVVEMYTATEGAFGQQMGDFPYWRPNYDLYLFEVKTGEGVKMLYEMERGEWGRLVLSTPMLPRYMIGDLVECMGKNYFRVFGRDKPRVIAEHVLYKALFGWMP